MLHYVPHTGCLSYALELFYSAEDCIPTAGSAVCPYMAPYAFFPSLKHLTRSFSCLLVDIAVLRTLWAKLVAVLFTDTAEKNVGIYSHLCCLSCLLYGKGGDAAV